MRGAPPARSVHGGVLHDGRTAFLDAAAARLLRRYYAMMLLFTLLRHAYYVMLILIVLRCYVYSFY